jgi:hypothetical protein
LGEDLVVESDEHYLMMIGSPKGVCRGRRVGEDIEPLRRNVQHFIERLAQVIEMLPTGSDGEAVNNRKVSKEERPWSLAGRCRIEAHEIKV